MNEIAVLLRPIGDVEQAVSRRVPGDDIPSKSQHISRSSRQIVQQLLDQRADRWPLTRFRGRSAPMPSTLALISTIFADPRQRALGFGIWATMFALGTADQKKTIAGSCP